MPEATCRHIERVGEILEPKRRECEDCVKTGFRWVQLRTCQECGGTRCRDDSPNRHASKHAELGGRPGVFAAGDVRSGTTKRCAFAAGDGALAMTCVHSYLGQSSPKSRGH